MGINRNANLAMLAIIADRLGALREKMIFLGGCTTGLLVTDPAAPDVRATVDVDMIVEVAASLEFHAVEAGMRGRGFQPDMESGIRCRWRSGDIIVDLMPDDESILGFSNRWYSDAIRHAVEDHLSSGIMIRRVTAPYFIATKIEAFVGRGKGDFMVSHDFEDIVTVIDGRDELSAEIAASEDSVCQFIGRTFVQWMHHKRGSSLSLYHSTGSSHIKLHLFNSPLVPAFFPASLPHLHQQRLSTPMNAKSVTVYSFFTHPFHQ